MPNAEVDRWMEQAQFVIRGTVERVGAVTLSALTASERTVVVRIDEVLHAPAQFSDHHDRPITMFSEAPGGLSPGQQAVFFTRSWLYGETLAVVEVGRLPMPDQESIRKDIAAANQGIADRQVADRIRQAELVVAGRVVRTARRLETPLFSSEHDPEWWDAFVEISSAEKGRPKSPLQILYANSLDEMWIDSPKCIPGQTGIWILQRDQAEKGLPAFRLPGLTALAPLDYHPLEQLERIRRLVRQGADG